MSVWKIVGVSVTKIKISAKVRCRGELLSLLFSSLVEYESIFQYSNRKKTKHKRIVEQ